MGGDSGGFGVEGGVESGGEERGWGCQMRDASRKITRVFDLRESFNCTLDDSDGILLWNCGAQFLDGRSSQFLELLLWKLVLYKFVQVTVSAFLFTC